MTRRSKRSPVMGAMVVLLTGAVLLGALPGAASAVEAKQVRAIADAEAQYVLASMERLKGKAILLPEVVADYGLMRYGEATGNRAILDRVAALYRAAYLEEGSLNRLSRGHLESQITALVPLELYRLTGDESLLKDCWALVEGQRRGAGKDGAYRHARWSSDEVFIITMLQTAAYRVYRRRECREFAARNMALYLGRQQGEKTFLDQWTQWDPEGKLVGVSLAGLLMILPLDHPMRDEFNRQFVPAQGNSDPDGSFVGMSLAELSRAPLTTRATREVFLREYRRIVDADLQRLQGGKMHEVSMMPFIQLYSMATGVRYGWLKDAKYRKLLEAKWAEFAEGYQAPKLESWNVIYKPLLRSGGVLLFATAMLELDKKPAALHGKPQVAVGPLKRKFSDEEVSKALSLWGDLRHAEASDDAEVLEKVKKSFPFDGSNPLDLLVEMELYRLTGSYDNERKCVELLHDLLVEPLEDSALTALLFAQAFKAYGTVKFADAAIAAVEKDAGDEAIKAIVASELLEELPGNYAKRPALIAALKKLPRGKLNSALGRTTELLARRQKEAEAEALREGGKGENPVKNISDLKVPDDFQAEDIYEVGMSYAAALKKRQDKELAHEGARVLRKMCEKLQAPTGFFRHSVNSEGLCWSRASGQAIAGVVAFLEVLPEENDNRPFFLRVFKNMAYALERNQDADGLWHVLPEDFNSPQDRLGSAFFVAALATGLEQEWIHRLEFRDIVDLGWKGVQANVNDHGLLTNAAAPSKPRQIARSYALLPRVTGDPLGQAALRSAAAATRAYYASAVPGSEEDLMAVLGPLHEQLEDRYEGELPDGRILKHVSTKSSFDVTKTVDIRGKKKDVLMKAKPGVYTEEDFRLTNYEILDKEKMQVLPEAIKKVRYPVGGVSVWLADNPSVHTVTDDLGYCVLSMPYVPLPARGSNTKIMAQIPGFKPVSVNTHRNYINEMVAEVDDTDCSALPAGPSDRINGKLLAPVLLQHHRQERKGLLAMLGKDVETISIDNGVMLRPVYLRGKVVSAADGKPVNEASIWLKRNPFLMHRSGADGKFEIMVKDATLYEQTSDALMVTAPGYRPTEVPIESYMDDKLVLNMAPLNYKPIVQMDTNLPMVRIPGGFFRMGRGVTQHGRGDGDPSTRDYDIRNCWPVRTAHVPSFYFSQYQCDQRLRREIYAWAIENGYVCQDTGNLAFPLAANALSERDGLTPCYYTADLRVIRDERDLSDHLVCNWRADGYRLPTWAEWVYACRAGHTTGQFWGDDGGRYRDYFITRGALQTEIGTGGGWSVKHLSPARRMPLDWGIYDACLGQGRYEMTWDLRWWRADECYRPAGPTFREARLCERLSYGGRARLARSAIWLVDNIETQWYDRWPGNPIGFQYSGYADHLQNVTFDGGFSGTFGLRYWSRFVRTAEKICNDVSLLKPHNDPTLDLPGPVDLKTVGESIAMAKIPAATYSMGAANQATWPNERMANGISVCSSWPEHKVSVGRFEMGKFEVTVEQWRDVREWAEEHGYDDLPEGGLGAASSEDRRHPVVDVNWYDVVKWCNAASEKTGETPCYYDADGNVYRTGVIGNAVVRWEADGYRLPTEAEWEYASMTGVDAMYYWGDHPGLQYAWQYSRRGAKNSNNTSHPVGQLTGNRFGLYDTVGNVWEWCWDWTGPYPMTTDDKYDPKGPANRDEIKEFFEKNKNSRDPNVRKSMGRGGSLSRHVGRALRGGSYDLGMCKHAFFEAQQRGSRSPDEAKDTIGFRVVRTRD